MIRRLLSVLGFVHDDTDLPDTEYRIAAFRRIGVK
jgi:hypothetical protein